MPNARGNIPLVVSLWKGANAVGHVGYSITPISGLEHVQADDFCSYQSIFQHFSVLDYNTFNMQSRSLAYKIELMC